MRYFKLMMVFFLACLFLNFSTDCFADRETLFHNNSNYDIKIWSMTCYIATDNKQTCTDEVYSGYVAAHHSFKLTSETKNPKESSLVWKQAGMHITQAVIQNPLSGLDPKALITQFPICNDIHEDQVDGVLTLDIDPVTSRITCADEVLTSV